jgi:hypothetical protein
VASIGKQHPYPVHPSFLTDRAEGDIDPTDPEELFLPCFFPGHLFGYGFSVFEDLTTQGDGIFTFSVCQQAKVAYPYIVRGQDMEKEPSDELACLEGHYLLTLMICIIPP